MTASGIRKRVVISVFERVVRRLIGRKKDEDSDRNRVHLAAFGKHPAWDDHIPDVGLETARLSRVKELLYGEGIRGNIDSGTWDDRKTEHDQRDFQHFFGFYDEGNWMWGRLWSSVDGKGRSRYPMVVCLEAPGIILERSVKKVYKFLEQVEKDCRTAQTTEEVREIMSSRAERGSLELDTRKDATEDESGFSSLTALAARPEMGDELTGLIRLMYHIERDLAECRRSLGGTDTRTTRRMKSTPPSSAMRVPRCAASAPESMIIWANFLRQMIVEGVALWVICPTKSDWVDLLVGPTTTDDFSCLCIPPGELPLTTDIPYTIDDQFTARVYDLLQEVSSSGSARGKNSINT